MIGVGIGPCFAQGNINPAVAHFTANGFRPPWVADFAGASGAERYVAQGGASTFDAMFPGYSRSSAAWMRNSSGVWVETASGTPRIGHHTWNGSAWVNEGILIESEARTQLLHGTNAFATQTETVTAQAYTLEFEGTGSITLTGAHSATLNGTGANDRVSLTFTPSAGTLTLTPSGDVDDPQLEEGLTGSSYIPNHAGSGSVTRAADLLPATASLLPYSASGVSIAMRGEMTYADTGQNSTVRFFGWLNGGEYIYSDLATNGTYTGAHSVWQRDGVIADSVIEASPGAHSPGVSVPFAIASYHGPNIVNLAVNGTALTANETPVALADLSATDMDIAPTFNGTISSVAMWSDIIGNDGIEEASA